MSDLESFEQKYFPDPASSSFEIEGQAYGMKEVTLAPVTAEEIRDVLAHTEVIHTPEADFVLSPGQVWVVATQPVLEWEVEISEEQFWKILLMVGGPELAREVAMDVEDVLRWEGEGGSCLS